MKLFSIRHHKLRRNNQYLPSIQCKEIRAFPHFSIFVSAVIKNFYKFPVSHIFRVKKRKLTAAVLIFTSDQSPKSLFVLPYLWISEINYGASFRKQICLYNRIPFIFLIIYTISESNALGLSHNIFSVLILALIHGSIHKYMLSIPF